MARRAKGEGSVYRDTRQGGWVAAASVESDPLTGKRRRVRVRGKTKTEALSRLRDRMDTTDPAIFGALLDAWVSRGMPSKRPKSERTQESLRWLIDTHIGPTFSHVPTASIDVEKVEEFLQAKADEGMALSTIQKLRGVISQVFAYAVARRHTDWNPAALAVIPETKPRREGRSLTQAELNRLLVVCEDLDSERLGAWVHVAATLGLRPGEVSALEWGVIDFDNGTVVVARSLEPGPPPSLKPTKTGETRTIAAPDSLMSLLREHKTRQAAERLNMGKRWPMKWDQLVFVSQAGTPVQPPNIRRWLRRVAAEAGIEGAINPYDLRHTAASLLAAKGTPSLALSQLLGQKDPRTLARFYVHEVTPIISTAVTGWE